MEKKYFDEMVDNLTLGLNIFKKYSDKYSFEFTEWGDWLHVWDYNSKRIKLDKEDEELVVKSGWCKEFETLTGSEGYGFRT